MNDNNVQLTKYKQRTNEYFIDYFR